MGKAWCQMLRTLRDEGSKDPRANECAPRAPETRSAQVLGGTVSGGRGKKVGVLLARPVVLGGCLEVKRLVTLVRRHHCPTERAPPAVSLGARRDCARAHSPRRSKTGAGRTARMRVTHFIMMIKRFAESHGLPKVMGQPLGWAFCQWMRESTSCARWPRAT